LTLGARIQPEAWRGVSLDLTLLNALNEEYYSYFGNLTAPNYAVPGPPRQFRATLKAAF
jgi:outer membrane receptor protein involved in Fe transport